MLPGCTATSLVSFWSGVIPSGRHESGTAGANFQKVTLTCKVSFNAGRKWAEEVPQNLVFTN